MEDGDLLANISPEREPEPDAASILRRLLAGNEAYLGAATNSGDVSARLRAETASGQHPVAAIVACADSRVVPEHIFMAGLGELFTVRVAGNIVGPSQMGSIEYAMDAVGTKLVLVLGHTRCGAIEAAIAGGVDGDLAHITSSLQDTIGDERDPFRAACLNVRAGVSRIRANPKISRLIEHEGYLVEGALYHVEDGRVELLGDS